MEPLSFEDIVNIAEYEIERPSYRSRIIEYKKTRRIQLGEFITLVFENRETIRFQIQEMMRAERIVLEERIKEEINIYNKLLPQSNSLSATLLIEVTDQAKMREVLDSFIGIDQGCTTFLRIGNSLIEAEYEGGRSKENRISAVHYIRFALNDQQVHEFLSDYKKISFEIDHKDYLAQSQITKVIHNSLSHDLM
ncbi:MAG: DUF3501 family protein [SAR202 cluster bacterium]|nr:DUF3501 family protein [SAR202 cluster bacterium]|tara:strand:- start:15527 stop:16108 length:582 start_codon:yes stop_codon:yes gene_type:complete